MSRRGCGHFEIAATNVRRNSPATSESYILNGGNSALPKTSPTVRRSSFFVFAGILMRNCLVILFERHSAESFRKPTASERVYMEWETVPLKDATEKRDEQWPQTREQFEQLVVNYQDPLVRYAFRRLGNLMDAEDVAQEVFVRAFADRHKRKDVRRVSSYLYRMTANLCTDHLRRRQPLLVSLEEAREIPTSVANGVEMAMAAEALQKAEKLLQGIPEKQAEVIRLRVIDELTLREVAEVLGAPVTAIKSRLRHGLDNLRFIVARKGGSQR